MTENKFKRLIVASTIGAVILMVILVMVMIYQLISIKVHQDKIAHLEEQIAIYNQLVAEGEETVEKRSMREWIEREARKLGYTYMDN